MLNLGLSKVVAVWNRILIALLELNKHIYAVKSHATIITDNTTTTISVWQTSQNLIVASNLNILGVNTKHAIVMSLAINGENLLNFWIYFLAGFLNSLLNHSPTTVWHHSALARFVSLQTDDYVIYFWAFNVACWHCVNACWNMSFNVVHAALTLNCQVIVIEILPHMLRFLGSIRQEGFVAFVWGVVL
ncbi:Uncharacterised protein [Chlamydia trachomatis]|nr:Uncharacterised protein [Chlamydia trachomatis]